MQYRDINHGFVDLAISHRLKIGRYCAWTHVSCVSQYGQPVIGRQCAFQHMHCLICTMATQHPPCSRWWRWQRRGDSLLGGQHLPCPRHVQSTEMCDL